MGSGVAGDNVGANEVGRLVVGVIVGINRL